MRHDGIRTAKEINLDRCYAASDRQRDVSRRTQALLAAAGMDAPARRWFVATVENGADRAVAEKLVKAGIEVWLPIVMVMPPRKGRARRLTGKPRAPRSCLALKGYLFVRTAATGEAWSGLATVDGMTGLLGSSGRPLPVADAAVDLFRRFCADDPDAKATVSNALRIGDCVTVKDGPFRSFPGTVEAVDALRGMAEIAVLIFGRITPVHLDIAQVAKL